MDQIGFDCYSFRYLLCNFWEYCILPIVLLLLVLVILPKLRYLFGLYQSSYFILKKTSRSASFPKLQIKKWEHLQMRNIHFYLSSLFCALAVVAFLTGGVNYSCCLYKALCVGQFLMMLEEKEQRGWPFHPAVSGWIHLYGWHLTDVPPTYSKKNLK